MDVSSISAVSASIHGGIVIVTLRATDLFLRTRPLSAMPQYADETGASFAFHSTNLQADLTGMSI